jgi:cytochrome P450
LNDGSLESKKLHEEEVTANMLLFILSGYDSVSTALASSTYVLATNSDIQRKLREEIDAQEWNDDSQLTYDIVMNMTYIDMFVREVLRMHPIAVAAVKRECNTTTIVCSHEIEKGRYFLTIKSFLYSFLLYRFCHSTRCTQYPL